MTTENELSCDIGHSKNKETLTEAVKANRLEAEEIGDSLKRMSAQGEDPYMIMRRAEAIRVNNSSDDKHLRDTINGNLGDLPSVRDHIHSVLKSHHDLAEKSGNDILARTLTAKYGWALGHGQQTAFHDHDVEGMYIPKEHILKHTNDYDFVAGRFLRHKKLDSIHKLEDDGSLSPRAHLIISDNSFSSTTNPMIHSSTTQALKFHHHNLIDIHGPHIESNPEHKDAVKAYTIDSGEINRLAAAKNKGVEPKGDFEDKDLTEKHVDKVRNLINTAPKYDNPMTVFTGISRSSDPAKGVPTETQGTVKSVMRSFTSTSLDPSTALGFAESKKTEEKEKEIKQPIADVMELKIPPKTRGVYVESHSEHKTENEYLLHDNVTVEHDNEPRYFAKNGTIFRHWRGKVID